MINKTYMITRKIMGEPGGVSVMVERGSPKPGELGRYPLKHIVKHSPTGFEYGYGGSGPADLALSILCDHFEEQPSKADLYIGKLKAQRYYQRFKAAFIAPLEGQRNVITSNQISDFIQHLDAERKAKNDNR